MLLDATGGVGHSPAATAAWLRATEGRPDLADGRAAAKRYLQQASAATGVHIPGVVPTAWPIARFELACSLYPLLIGDLLDHPALADTLQPQIDELARALRPDGIGFTDAFIPDGDDTAEAMAVLHAAGRPVEPATIRRFERDNHFYSYPGELQPSLTTTAHATHVLGLLDLPRERPVAYLIERQQPDGRWFGDKWSISWLYATLQILVALRNTGDTAPLRQALGALLVYQHADGGWGAHSSVAEETAYGVLALRVLHGAGLLDHEGLAALRRARRWMLEHYQPFRADAEMLWQAKEIYRPHRIARAFELAATFPHEELG
jgi:hypothetical protein